MLEQSLGEKYSKFVNVLIFIFPIVIISVKIGGDIVLFILAMMGILIAISQKLSPFVIKEIKVFSYLAIGYFMAVCLSVLFSGQAAELAHYIPRDLYFLLAPFIALALYKAEININYLVFGAKVALLVLGIIVIMQLLNGRYRPSGVMNANIFGNLSVLLFFVVFVFFKDELFKHKVFSFFSLMSGLLIIVASGSRGAWLSFLLLSVSYIYFYYKQKNSLSIKSKFFIVLIIAVVSFSGTIKFNNELGGKVSSYERFHTIYTEISDSISGDQSLTSSGIRIEMYTKAIDNINNVPFFGHGYRTSNIVLFKNDLRAIGKQIFGYNHLHNAYLTNYFNGGIILLGALLSLLLVPFRMFIKANNQNPENPLYIFGVLLTLGYASIGMVNILLGDTYMNGFYVFFLAIFLLQSNKAIELPKT